MTTEEARKVLDSLKNKLALFQTDTYTRKLYYDAIETAVEGMNNYELLLTRMLNENKQKLIEEQHKIDMQIQRYEMFKNFGGNIP